MDTVMASATPRGRTIRNVTMIAAVAIVSIVAAMAFIERDSSGGAASGSAPRSWVWAALGDSFASGEGSTQSGGWSDACHRSSTAYADQAADQLRRDGDQVRLTMAACTGATTAALTSSFKGQPPQIDAVGPGTNLVTVTMGGNDAGFVELVAGCILSTRNCPPGDWSQRLTALDASLASMVEAILDDGDLVAGARIVLVGYPQLLPEDRPCPPFSDASRTAGRRIIADIDATIAAVAARFGNRGVEMLDPTTSKRWVGHEACPAAGKAAFVNPLSFSLASGTPLHPNEAGHGAYAADLVALLRSGS